MTNVAPAVEPSPWWLNVVGVVLLIPGVAALHSASTFLARAPAPYAEHAGA